MGRWAQAKRRGSGATRAAGLGPPPAPVLAIVDGAYRQIAQGGDDTGGIINFGRSDVPGGPYSLVANSAWEADHYWDDVGALDPGYYAGNEQGNGVAYVGTSAPSNELHVT